MSTPHVIRLRGPWKCEPRGRVAGKPVADQAGPGLVCYTRRFNLPTNLAPDERVWLVCQGLDGRAALALNGRPLGTLDRQAAGRFDITDWLAAHNVLEIDAESVTQAEPNAFPGEVRLEIGRAEPDS